MNFTNMLERFSYRGWNNAYKLSNGISTEPIRKPR